MFKPRIARRNLEQFRRKGLGAIERHMVSTIPSTTLDGGRVLEIGGGIGAIQTELLESGAREGEVLELVSAYEPYARELARERGLEARSRFRVTDILEHPDSARAATIVVLNRVVCCSPDGVRLTELAAGLTERLLILSFPRKRLLVRAGVTAINIIQRLIGRPFRVFLHPRTALSAAAHAQGLTLAASGHNFAWEFMTFQRPHAAPTRD